MLSREEAIQYIGQNAPLYGVDPAAMLSVANFEGLNVTPGNTWRLPGEAGYNFGPPSWYSGPPAAAGTPIVQQQGTNAPSWSWSPAGLNYWIQQIANVASGLTGRAAISSIVNNFERPREDLRLGEINNAASVYQSFQQQIGGGGSGSGEPTPSQPTPSQPSNGQTPTPNTSGIGGRTTSAELSFADSIQHILAQGSFVLIGLVLLLGGIYLIGRR